MKHLKEMMEQRNRELEQQNEDLIQRVADKQDSLKLVGGQKCFGVPTKTSNKQNRRCSSA